MYSSIFQKIDVINKSSSYTDEGWGFIQFKGKWYEGLQGLLLELSLELMKVSCSISISIEGDTIPITEMTDFNINDSWTININKKEFQSENTHFHFFYHLDLFIKWSKESNSFDTENPINKYNRLKIVVKELKKSFGGVNFAVLKKSGEEFSESLYNLPSEKEITQIVHIVSENQVSINPQKHIILNSYSQDECANSFLRSSAIILVSSFVNEFYSIDKVILKGIKRVQLRLINEETTVDLNFIHKLAELVSWIYDDKVETRQKLFVDRITLDINYDLPLIDELKRVIDSSFQQAKERYNFVIIDRKENYLKEVRDLLKDIKSQSDLYSNKIRNLLGNLLRDALAGFLLVGFSLFTKLTEIQKLAHAEYFFNTVFKGLAIYFVGSAIIQAVIDITDMIISRKEMLYWKNVSREYIPQDEFNRHIQESLKKRIISVWVFYILLILFYFIIAFAAWTFPYIWKTYINN